MGTCGDRGTLSLVVGNSWAEIAARWGWKGALLLGGGGAWASLSPSRVRDALNK